MYDNTFIDKNGHPQMISKYQPLVNGNPTGTPIVNFATELLYAMGNITKLVNTEWFGKPHRRCVDSKKKLIP